MWPLKWKKDQGSPQRSQISAAAYLLTEVLGGDAEDVQAQGGLLQLGLKALQLQGLLLTTFSQLLDQSPVQLLGPFSPNRSRTSCRCCCCPPTHYRNRQQGNEQNVQNHFLLSVFVSKESLRTGRLTWQQHWLSVSRSIFINNSDHD